MNLHPITLALIAAGVVTLDAQRWAFERQSPEMFAGYVRKES